MNIKAIYPGTFDPITYGHLDIIERASALFSHLIVAITNNTAKSPWLDLETRHRLMSAQTRLFTNVTVVTFDGLLVDFAKKEQASVLVRGVRGITDFDYESQMATANRQLAPALETILLTPSPAVQAVSSSLVRDVARFSGDITAWVPEAVAEVLASVSDPKRGGVHGT